MSSGAKCIILCCGQLKFNIVIHKIALKLKETGKYNSLIKKKVEKISKEEAINGEKNKDTWLQIDDWDKLLFLKKKTYRN